MKINDILLEIIENKHVELQKLKPKGIFDKINNFEANAIGQIGESFIKRLCIENNIKIDLSQPTVVHNEYDVIINDTWVEIKTARKGLKNDTCQFNGINPDYQNKYIILIGLYATEARYLILSKEITSKNRARKRYIKVEGKDKKLVEMNPRNDVNLKLTLKFKDLKPIQDIVTDIKNTIK